MLEFSPYFDLHKQIKHPLKNYYCVTNLKKGRYISQKINPLLQQHNFPQTYTVSFSGLPKLYRIAPNFFPKIETLSGVSDIYAFNASEQICKFPCKWLRQLKKENYKIILSKTIQQAYKSEKVFEPTVELFEKENPLGTLGVTYSEIVSGKNFFVFCDKPPDSHKYLKGIINHELSHGVMNITGLNKNQKTIELLKKDVDLIIKNRKLDNLTSAERKMVSYYFFNQNAYSPIDEITADVYAWNNGGGFYGSGLIGDTANPELIKNLFPNLSEFLKAI